MKEFFAYISWWFSGKTERTLKYYCKDSYKKHRSMTNYSQNYKTMVSFCMKCGCTWDVSRDKEILD